MSRRVILEGKTIIFLGSSVTYGSAAEGRSFVEALADADGIIPVKEAVSGTTLVTESDNSYIPRMLTISKDIKADAFVCQLSTNDASRPWGLDSIETAIDTIIDYARETWHCPVVFYTSPRMDNPKYADMVTMLHKIAEEKNIIVIDLWNDEDMLTVSDADRVYYMADAAHPTWAGYSEWWLPKFEEGLCKLFIGNE